MNVKFLLFFTWDPENPRPRPKSIPLFTLNIWHITMRDHGTGLFSFTCVEICKSWHFGRLQDWCQVDLQLKNPIFSQLCTEIWLFCCLSCGYCHFTNSVGAMYCLIYIFFRFYCWRFNFQKIFFWILPNSKKVRGTPAPTEYGSTVKNLTLGFSPKLSGGIPIHVWKPGKKFGPKSQC